MQNSRKFGRAGLALFVIVVLVVGFLVYKFAFSKTALVEREKTMLPTPLAAVAGSQQSVVSIMNSPIPATSHQIPTTDSIPAELNLDVPFTSQAPNANWDYTHEEACEEAAILMAGRYFRGQSIASPDDAEKGLREIISWEKENLGFFESTTAEETVRVIRGIYGLNAEIIENPTVDQIKSALASKKLVLVPTAGRLVGNPFYKSPGPLYHFLLIKGYTKTQFITNDAGTKRGENYPYKFQTILNANHDWNGGDVENGQKVIIFVSG